eukprot:5552598-Pleurochrysis_carterae.AAC.4
MAQLPSSDADCDLSRSGKLSAPFRSCRENLGTSYRRSALLALRFAREAPTRRQRQLGRLPRANFWLLSTYLYVILRRASRRPRIVVDRSWEPKRRCGRLKDASCARSRSSVFKWTLRKAPISSTSQCLSMARSRAG